MGDVMRATTTILLICIVVFVAACAAHPDPIVDMKGVDREEFDQDWAECESYTDEVLVSRGVAKGAALGAAIGAVAGAIGGNSSDVAEGAAYGGVYGGTGSGLDADREKQQVFKRCMRGRGYRVLN
jgi:hypothetical protein